MPLYDVLQANPSAYRTGPTLYDRTQAAQLQRPEPMTGIEEERVFGNPLSRGLGQATRSMKGSMKDYVASALDAMGAQEAAKGWWASGKQDAERAAYVGPEIQRLEQITDADTAAQWALNAFGQGAAYVPATIAAAAAGRVGLGRALGPMRGSMVGGAGLMLPAEGGQAAREMHDDPAAAGMGAGEKFLRATGVGAANAGLEMLPEAGMVNHMLARAPVTSVRQALRNTGKEILKNSAEEAATEAAQDVTGQINKLNYDPAARFDAMQTVNAAAQGGVGAAPIIAPHAAAAQALDLAAGNGKLGFDKAADLAGSGARKISDTAMKAAGKAFDKVVPIAGDAKEAWHTFREHPEMAQLMGDQSLPAELASAPDSDILAWASSKDAAHRDAALAIAQRTLESPASTPAAKEEAQALLTNPDNPEAWKPFVAARVLEEKSRRVGANIREAAGALGSKAGDIIGQVDLGTPEGRELAANKAGLAVRAAGQTAKAAVSGLTKKNLEPTQEDSTYTHFMLPEMEKAFGGKLSDDVVYAAASVLKDFVLGGFNANEHGNVEVPRGLIAAFGENTPHVIERAYDTLRRQGRTQHIGNFAELMGKVKEEVGLSGPVHKNAAAAVRHNLTPEWNDVLQDHDHAALADGIRRYINSGKKDKATEQHLDELFGANKDVVLEDIGRGMARSELKAKSYGEGLGNTARTNTDVREGDEMGSDASAKDYDSPLGEREPTYDYHFQNKDGAPYDVTNAFHLAQMNRVPNELDSGRYNTRHDRDTGKDFVHTEPVGVVDHARQTGDNRALSGLYKKHEADFEKLGDEGLDRMLNSRYKVLRTQERMDDAADPLEIPERELRMHATVSGGVNKRSWRDVTSYKGKDVSGAEFGRVHLKQKDGDMFVTSAQKLISKMWEAKSKRGAFEGKTLEATGNQDMLNMFAAGLGSLLATDKFSGMEIKLADGSWQTVDSVEDFPKDFTLFTKPGGEKVTIGSIREAKQRGYNKAVAKENNVARDAETKQEHIYATEDEANKHVDREAGQFVAPHELGYAVYEKNGVEVPSETAREQALSYETRIVGRQTHIVDRDENGNLLGKKPSAGPNDTLKKVDGRWQLEKDLGFKTERTPVHSTETEEFASKAEDAERNFDEATGLELHPKMAAGEQRNEALALTRKLYSEAVGKLRDMQANGASLRSVNEQRKVVERLLEQGKDLVDRNAITTKRKEPADKLEPASNQALKNVSSERQGDSITLEKVRARHLNSVLREIKELERNNGSKERIAELKAEADSYRNGAFNSEPVDRISGKFATPEQMKEAQDYVAKTLGPQMQAEWVKGFPHGGSGEWQNGVIRIAMTALNPLSVAHHESMHELFARITSAGRDKSAQALLQAANSPLTVRRLERFFADEKYAAVREQLKVDPEERLAYMYQLWASGKMKFGPETQTVFQKVANFLRKTFGLLTADQKAEMIFQAFYDGKMAEPSAMAQVLDDIEARGETIKSIGKRLEKPLRMANELVGTAENNMANSKNPAVREIQKLFSNRVGDADEHQGFLQAHIQANNQWLNKMGTALRPNEHVEKEDLAAALEGLQKGERSNDPIISAIQDNVRKVLDDMHDYMVKADVRRFDTEKKEWVPIQKVANYFPRSWDTSQLTLNADKFLSALMEHHRDALEAIAAKANEELANDSDAGEYTASWEKRNAKDDTPVTAEDVAHAIHQRLLNADGQADLGESTNSLGYTPMMKAVNQRTLDWIDMKHFAEFQRKDIIQTLTTYVNQATKRAEYAKTFGGDGKVLEEKMTAAWTHEIDTMAKERFGVDNAVATARSSAAMNRVDWREELANVLAQSKETTQSLIDEGLKNLEPARRAIMAMEGTLGHDISPLLRKASAYSIVYQNTRLLAYAMFSNLIDPLGIVLRGGEMKDAYSAFKRGMTSVAREWGDLTGLREAKASDTDEATRVAEMIGTVDCAGFMSTMGTMYGSQYLPQWARNWNDNFFRWNGMESFNKAMRVQATQAAIGFIKRHAEGVNEHSERYLKELGLTADDVKVGEGGELNVEDPKIQKAVMRWVDGAILRPNAAMRPAWMSDPHFAVFGHLKQFMYATHQVLLKRVVHEVRNGNTNPVYLMLAGYVPVMLAADAAKGILQEITGGGAPMWEHDSAAGIMSHGAQRAGLLGQGQMAVDGVKYGPTSLLGPQAEQITSAFSKPISESLKEAVAVGPLNILTKGAAMTNAVD